MYIIFRKMIKINWTNLRLLLTNQKPNLALPYSMDEVENYYNKGHAKLPKDFEDYLTHVSREIIDAQRNKHLFNLSIPHITSKTSPLQIYLGINISNKSQMDIIKSCNPDHPEIDIQNSIISENMILLSEKRPVGGLAFRDGAKIGIAHTSFSSYLQAYISWIHILYSIPFRMYPESYVPTGHYNMSKARELPLYPI